MDECMSETTNNMNDWTPDPPDDSSDPLGILGEVIAEKYRIESFIGEGGFGKVYTGINIKLVQQKIVIKFFTESKLQDRFDKEAEIICKLDHPGICSLIDYLAEERALVIPYIDGIDLHRYLEENGALGDALYMRVAHTILEAITYAHSKSIAHRDIKPSNIMLDTNNNVYLIDFGIAKESKNSSTETMFFVGTPDFSAPERRRREKVYNPFLSDIYELGVTLYYLATRTHLYRDRDHPDCSDWKQPASGRLSPRVKRVLKKATHPDPEKRYQTIAEMTADFHKIRRPYRLLPQALRRTATMAAMVVILFGVDALNQQFQVANLPTLIPWGVATMDAELVDDSTQSVKPDTVNVQQSIAELPETITEPQSPPPVVETQSDTKIQPLDTTPVIPRMKVTIEPEGPVRLRVDGEDRPVDNYFTSSPGQHEIVIEHGDFPIYQTVASVSADTARLFFDLRERLGGLDSTNVILITLPRNTAYGFNLFCNGKDHPFLRPREYGFYLMDGLWHIATDVSPLDKSSISLPQVDSIVVGVVGKSTTFTIPGDEGLLQVSSGPAGDQKMRLLIYWSEVQTNAGR